MFRPMKTEEIGAAKVGQTFNANGRKWMRNEEIPIDLLRTWRNVPTMIEKGYIHAYPANVTVLRKDSAAVNPSVSVPGDEGDIRRMVITKGFGNFDVIEGRVLAKGVSKAEAHRVAGIPLEAERPRPKPPAAPKQPAPKANHPGPPKFADKAPPAMPTGVGPKDEDGNGPIDP